MAKRVPAILGVCAIILASACTSGPAAVPTVTQTSRVEPTYYASVTITATFTESATQPASPTPTFAPASSASPTRPNRTPLDTPTPIASLRAGQAITLTELHMIDRLKGWGVESGGHAVYTADGGITWRDASPYEVNALYSFVDAGHAWAFPFGLDPCSDGMGCDYHGQLMHEAFVWRTSDAGRTWSAGEPFDFFGLPAIFPVALDFTDLRSGWFLFIDYFGMSGSTMSALGSSQDSGQTWSIVSSSSDSCRATALMFLDGSTGWSGSDCRYVSAIVPQPLQEFIASGVSPSIEKTLDGGATWTYEHIPASTILPDNLRYEAPPGMTEAVGVKCGAERIQRISAQAFLSIEGCSQGYAIESAFRYGFLTPDGGATWLNWLASGDEFFVTSSRGWRTLPSESGGLSKLQRSDDGGRTWTTIRSVAWEDVTFDFIDELTGWVVGTVAGQRGLAYTEDGGDTWVVLRPVAAP